MIIANDISENVRGALTDGFQAKTGVGVRVTLQSVTCPAACPFNTEDGPCYAKTGTVSWFWSKLDKGNAGVAWPMLVHQVGGMPLGQWWRWAQAGDCPSEGKNRIDRSKMLEVARAAKGRPVVGYTHYPVSDGSREAAWNVQVLREISAEGFTLNVSCETVEQVDRAVRLGLPCVIVQPEDAPDTLVTPDGNRGVFCPAQRDTSGMTTCFGGRGVIEKGQPAVQTKACGNGIPLCSRGELRANGYGCGVSRDWFVIFKSHGVRKAALNAAFANNTLPLAA